MEAHQRQLLVGLSLLVRRFTAVKKVYKNEILLVILLEIY